MKKMNLPNKITVARIVLSVICLIMMVIPFHQIGIEWPVYEVFGRVEVDLKYIVCAVIFIIASTTDFLDGYIARKYNLVTDFGKVMDLYLPQFRSSSSREILSSIRLRWSQDRKVEKPSALA